MTDQTDKPKDGVISKYGKKRASGKMMYGPGCCAHHISQAEVDKARQRAQAAGHFSARSNAEELSNHEDSI